MSSSPAVPVLAMVVFGAVGVAPVSTQANAASDSDELLLALGGEFARVAGEHLAAARAWLAAAERSGRPEHAERAAQLALLGRDYALARTAITLWQRAQPDAEQAELLAAVAALGLGDAVGAERALTALLERGGRERSFKVLRLLSTAEAEPLAPGLLAVLVELPAFRTLTPEEVPIVPLALRLGQVDLAERVAERATRDHPKSARAWLWRAQVAQARRETEAAADHLTRALQLRPDDVELRLTLAQQLNELGRFDRVDAVLRAAPEPTELIVAARIAYLAARSDRRGARRLAREVERMGKLSAEQREFFLGQLGEVAEDRARALAHYRKIGPGERQGEARLRIAVLLADQDWEATARELVALQEQSEDPRLRRDAYLLEAELLGGKQRHQEAAEVLSRALAVFVDDAELLYARALAYAQAEQIQYAETDLKLLIARDPNHGHALNALGYTLADRTDRLQEAYDYIRRALVLLPNEAAVLDSMGWVYYRLGKLPDALSYLERAYALNPDPEIAAHLGEVLWAKGRQEDARAIWRQALKRAPEHVVLRATIGRFDQSLLPT